MKNTLKKFVLIFVFCLLGVVSCQNEDTLMEPELKIEKLDLSELNLDLGKGTKYDFPVTTNKEALKKIEELNEHLNEVVTKDKKLKFVTYVITVSSSGIKISDFIFNDSSKNGQYTFTDALDDGWDCPEGATLVASCYSQSCVQNAIASQFEDFSSGDTVVITVHHGGTFGGATVCVS